MYESFYNLSARPFQLMPDPRLLFESRDHKRALSYLLYGLERREGFVVITGDVGMGKTLLVQTLLGQLRTRNLSLARVSMANLDGSAVLPGVAAAFGLEHKSRSKIEILDDLVKRLLPTQNRGALLIVDEAQTCTVEALEELRAVSNLQANGRALLQVFLVGQTEVRDRLALPAMSHLRQRIVAFHHLQPLDVDEVRSYIQHRLNLVGWEDNPSFTDEVYTRVHEWSGGVPRRINLLMDRFLLYGYLEQLTELGIEDLEVVIAEFDDEFANDTLALGNVPTADGGGDISNADVDALNQRMEMIEKGLGTALGRKRAAELIDKHQHRIESREVIAARMRISRLESLLSELLAQETSPGMPEQKRLGASEKSDSAAPSKPVLTPVSSQPERSAASYTPDADDTSNLSVSSLAEAIDEITPAERRRPHDEPGTAARRRLFSRRKKDEY